MTQKGNIQRATMSDWWFLLEMHISLVEGAQENNEGCHVIELPSANVT